MNNKKVRIGIIGCGWIVVHAHIPALLHNENVIVKAIYDTDKDRVKKVCDTFFIPNAFHDFEQFIECGLDGVIIATPNYTHVSYTLRALSHNINVLCEKPVALNASEVVHINKVIAEKNLIYVPGFVNRWRQDVKLMHDLIQNDVLGKILEVDGGWIRRYGVPRPGTWFTNKDLAGGGVLTDLGAHVVDICNFFLGNLKPISYHLLTSICDNQKLQLSGAAEWFQNKSNDLNQYELNVEDSAIACVVFEGNVIMNIALSWRAPIEADCTYFKILGTKGKLTLKTLFGFSDERLWKEDVLECDYDGCHKVIHFKRDENNTKNAFHEMISYFVNAILNKDKEFINGYDALKTVSLIENLYRHEEVNEKSVYAYFSGGKMF